MPDSGKRSYDTGASGSAQANLAGTAGLLESLISARDAQVKAAMANFSADGVSDEYHAKELQWNSAASEVRQIITLVKSVLGQNDETAGQALAAARAAVAGIV